MVNKRSVKIVKCKSTEVSPPFFYRLGLKISGQDFFTDFKDKKEAIAFCVQNDLNVPRIEYGD